MQKQLRLDILPQPDNTTCGPTCLHAVYRYFGLELPLGQLILDVPTLQHGGTLAVLLGCDALQRGFDASIYTYNLEVFDPTWFRPGGPDLIQRLRAQMAVKESPRLRTASLAYVQFLQQGGTIQMQDLNGALIRRYLNRSIPILTGLCSTYLYTDPRELGHDGRPDDVHGSATGHFVVLCGYDKLLRKVSVADPYLPNPFGLEHYYEVGLDRLICAILLGVLTYDANLLIITPHRRSTR